MDKETNDLVPLAIDLNQTELTESFLAMFGSTVKLILQRMFGSGGMIPKRNSQGDALSG